MSELSDSSDSTLTCTSLDDGDEVFWGTPKHREIELEKAYLRAIESNSNHGGIEPNIDVDNEIDSKQKFNSSEKSILSSNNESNQSLCCMLDNNINGDNSQSSEQENENNKFNLLDGSLSQISFNKTNLLESTSMDNNSDDSVLTLNSTTNNVNARGFLNLVDALLTNKLNEEKNNEQDDNNVESDALLPEPILNSNISISDVDMSEDTLNHVTHDTINLAELGEHVQIKQSRENTLIGEHVSMDVPDLNSNQQIAENELEIKPINTTNAPTFPLFENNSILGSMTANEIFESNHNESNEQLMDNFEFNNNIEQNQNKDVSEPTTEASKTLNLSNNSNIFEVNESKRSEEISFGNILEKNISSEASLDLSTSIENTLNGDYTVKTQSSISSVIDEKCQQFEANLCIDKSIIEAEPKNIFDSSITSEVDKNEMIERTSLSSNVLSPLSVKNLEEEKMETDLELSVVNEKCELQIKDNVENEIDVVSKSLTDYTNIENNSSESNEPKIIEDIENLAEEKIETKDEQELSTVDEQLQMKCELQAKGNIEDQMIDFEPNCLVDCQNIDNNSSESNENKFINDTYLENLEETMETIADNELSSVGKCDQLAKSDVEKTIINEPKNLLCLSNFENNSSESNEHEIIEDNDMENLEEEKMKTKVEHELSTIDEKCELQQKGNVENQINYCSNVENNSTESNENKITENMDLLNGEETMETKAEHELSTIDEECELQAKGNNENQMMDFELDCSNVENNSTESNGNKITEVMELVNGEETMKAIAENELSTFDQKYEQLTKSDVEKTIIDDLLNLSNSENNSSELNELKFVKDTNISSLNLSSNVEFAVENVEKEKSEANAEHDFSLTKIELPAVDHKYESILDRDNIEKVISDAESLSDLNEMDIDNSPFVTQQELVENTDFENIDNNNSNQIILDMSNRSVLAGENVEEEMPVNEEKEEPELPSTNQTFEVLPITSVLEGSMNVEQKSMLILSDIEDNLKSNESEVNVNDTSIENVDNKDSLNSPLNVEIAIETKDKLKEPNLYLKADLLDSDIPKMEDFQMKNETLNLDILENDKEAISKNPVSNGNLLDLSINEIAFKFNENQTAETSISEPINEEILDYEITGNTLENKVELNVRAVNNSEGNALLDLSNTDDVAKVKSSEVMDFEEDTNLFTENLNSILPKVDSCKSLLDMSLPDFELKSNDNEKSKEQEINNIDTNIETSHCLVGNLLLSDNLLDLSLSNLEDKLITHLSHEEFQIGMDKINENAKSLIESPIAETNEAILMEENISDKKESVESIEFNNLLDMDMPESLLDTSDNRLKNDAFIKTESMPETASKRKLAVSANNTESKRPRVLIPPTDLSKLRSPLTTISRSAMSKVNTNLGSIQKKLILDDSVGKSISKLARPTTMGALCHSKLRTPSDYNSSNDKIQQKMSACKSSQIPTNLSVASCSKLNFPSCTSAIPTLANGIKSSIPTSIGGIPPSSTKAKGSRLPTLNKMQLGR